MSWLAALALSVASSGAGPAEERGPQRREQREQKKQERAQKQAEKKKKFRKHRVLPVPVLRTEPGVGFTTGLRGRYIYRRKDDQLSRVVLDLVARVSLTRVQHYQMRLRLRDLIGNNEVFDINFEFRDDPVFNFTGVANNTILRNRDLVDDFFEGDRFSIGPDLNYQHPIRDYQPDEWWGETMGALRGFAGWRFQYDKLRARPDTLIATTQMAELRTSRRGLLYGGIAWDSRDNDYSPRTGGFHDVSLGLAGPWAGGDRDYAQVNVSLRRYTPLGTKKVVLANELLVEKLWGDVPLLSKGEFSGLVYREGIGGLFTGRGFLRRRFIGDLKAFTSIEVRYEPYELHVGRITATPGFKPFMDVGFVSDETVRPRVPGPLFHVSGGGGVYIVIDRVASLRFDAGFSAEGFSAILAADHAF